MESAKHTPLNTSEHSSAPPVKDKTAIKKGRYDLEVETAVESVLRLEDQAFEDWQREEKAIEGNSLQTVHQKSQRVPFRLTSLIQVFVPAELSLAVQHMWEKVEISEWEGMMKDKVTHKVNVWSNFLRLVLESVPDNLKTSKTALSPVSRRYLMRLAFHKLSKAIEGNDIHVITKGRPDQLLEATIKLPMN